MVQWSDKATTFHMRLILLVGVYVKAVCVESRALKTAHQVCRFTVDVTVWPPSNLPDLVGCKPIRMWLYHAQVNSK